jgi:hypothetical protein
MWNVRYYVMLLGAVIGLLLIMSGGRLDAHDYRNGILCLAVAGALAFAFFRKRQTILAISSLSWVLVNAGLICPQPPD